MHHVPIKIVGSKELRHINMYLHTAFVRNEITFLQFEVDLNVIDIKYYSLVKWLEKFPFWQ